MKMWLWPEVGESGEGCASVCWQIPELEHSVPLLTLWSFIIGFTSVLQFLLCSLKSVAGSRPGIAASSQRAQGHLLQMSSWMCLSDGVEKVSTHPHGESAGSAAGCLALL